jgi:hypothetical protein
MSVVRVEGIDEAIKAIEELGNRSVSRSTINALARKALLPVKTAAKNTLKATPVESSNNMGGFSKLKHVANNLKIFASKSRRFPGSTLYVKGPDVPVDAKNKRWWNIGGYVALLSFGADGERFHKNGKSTGRFKGFGNFLYKGYLRAEGLMRVIFLSGMRDELEKQAQKAIKRYARRK